MIYSRCWQTPFRSRNNTRDTGPISGRELIDDTEWCGFYEKLGCFGCGGLTDASHPSWSTEQRGAAGGCVSRSLCLTCITAKVTKGRRGDKVRHLELIQSNLKPSLFFSVKKRLDRDETKLLMFWKINTPLSLKSRRSFNRTYRFPEGITSILKTLQPNLDDKLLYLLHNK